MELTKRQQSILDILAQHHGLTTREIGQKIYPEDSPKIAQDRIRPEMIRLKAFGHVESEASDDGVTRWVARGRYEPVSDKPAPNLVMVTDEPVKPAEYAPEEITESVIQAIEAQTEKSKSYYRLMPKTFTLINSEDSESSVFVANAGVYVNNLTFKTPEQVDEFAAIIKDLFKQIA